jgi:hypothetical protein
MVLFGDRIGFAGWLGIGIIIASCVAAAALVARRPATPILESTIASAHK